MPRCARCFGEVHELAVFCPGCGQPHAPAFDQLLNCVIGERYQVYRRLDKGGLSAVFAAIDLPTDHIVVVKFSDPSQLAKRELTYALAAEEARRYWAEMLERMRREAEALTQIRHRNIVRLYDTDTLNADLRYVVMEYLRGRTLREELAARPKLPLSEALNIAIALADALHEIHSRGIVHRDLNPRNVMLCAEVEAKAKQSAIRRPRSAIKLIDFGIAKFPQPPGAPPFTQHSILSGTVAYASPEQCQNQPLDQRTDLYSLGIVLYEMVTGERPFTGRTPTEIALKQIQAHAQPPRELAPELPLSLETTILRALAKDPAERHAHIGELADELRAIAQRFVVALPEKPPASSSPTLFGTNKASAATRQSALAEPNAPAIIPADESERPIFTAYPQRAASRWRKLAYAAVLLLFISGAAFLAKDRLGKTLPTSFNDLALNSPLAGPTATPLSIDKVFAPASETPLVIEPILPAPEAEMAQAHAAFALPPFWNRVRSFAKPRPTQSSSRKPLGPKLTQPTAAAIIPPSVRPEPQVFKWPEPAHTSTTPDLAENISAPPQPSATPETTMRPRRQRETGANPVYETISSTNPEEEPDDNASTRVAESASDRDFSPTVIAWSGAVSGERVIRLEMPGVPGRIEIPRSYRHRVGVVESPNTGNRWRVAVLRVFGRGECSIILRWWPRGH